MVVFLIFQYSYELPSVALRNIKEILQTPYGRFPDFSIFLRAPFGRSPQYKRNPTNSLWSFSGFFNSTRIRALAGGGFAPLPNE